MQPHTKIERGLRSHIYIYIILICDSCIEKKNIIVFDRKNQEIELMRVKEKRKQIK